MNRKTVAELVLYVTQLQPAQKIDELTADAWFDVIGHINATLTEAKRAVARVASRQQWIGAGDVKGELSSMLRPGRFQSHAAAIEAPSKFESDEARAERIRRRLAEVQDEIEKHRRESEPEVEEGVSETLQRAREVARQYKRERDAQPDPPAPKPLAGTVGRNPDVLVEKFKQIRERTAE